MPLCFITFHSFPNLQVCSLDVRPSIKQGTQIFELSSIKKAQGMWGAASPHRHVPGVCKSQSNGLGAIHSVTLLTDQHLFNTYCMQALWWAEMPHRWDMEHIFLSCLQPWGEMDIQVIHNHSVECSSRDTAIEGTGSVNGLAFSWIKFSSWAETWGEVIVGWMGEEVWRIIDAEKNGLSTRWFVCVYHISNSNKGSSNVVTVVG